MPGISELIDSDMEGNDYMDENSIISSASDATNLPQNTKDTKKPKKAAKRQRVTMPKPRSKVAKPSPKNASRKATTKTTAAKDTALQEAVADDLGQEFDGPEEVVETEPKSKSRTKGRPNATKTANAARALTERTSNEDDEIEETSAAARSNHARTATVKAPKVVKAVKTSAVKKKKQTPVTDGIPDNQQESIEQEMDMGDVESEAINVPLPSHQARAESRTRQESTYRRRAGSASDTERGDPNLRRRLGDITRKFENVDTKYKNLKEVGISEASANVEKLRLQCEAATEASNNLIASLKKELAQQTSLAQEARELKKALQMRDEETAKLRATQAETAAALGSAHHEIKALQAKLTAARSASNEPVAVKAPSSAMKPPRSAMVNTAEAAQAARITQMKLDLYGDLTGLIVRSVKHSADGDTYECIQTGRNGTLHFKLFIDQEDAKSASFEDTEFLYTPLLDQDRDHDMMELMPPYLTEDITFARQNAAKFYQRVVDTLTRRLNET